MLGRGRVLALVRTASSSSASARRRCRQTWCTPMTMESMEKRTEESEAVCGRGLMFYVVVFFFGVSNLYYISHPSSLEMRGWQRVRRLNDVQVQLGRRRWHWYCGKWISLFMQKKNRTGYVRDEYGSQKDSSRTTRQASSSPTP